MLPSRSALYLPASNPRAVQKARDLPADMIIFDLEDAVPLGLKDEAREAALQATEAGFGDRLTAIRINGPETNWHAADVAAVRQSRCNFVVVPKVESASVAASLAELTHKPLFAMIETPAGLYGAREIAAADDCAGLIAGVNDLANTLHIPPGAGRSGLSFALQSIVLAARASGVWALDGVYNDLADGEGLAAEAREGRVFGFDGKTLIHPNQIDCANQIWSPTDTEIAEARALIEAATGGAERHGDRMIESMHVEMAKRLLARIC